MSNLSKARIGAAALLLGFAALDILLLLTAIHAVGTDAGLYYKLQIRAWAGRDAASAAGISDGDLRMLDGRLADYLAGDPDALRDPGSGDAIVQVSVDGVLRPAFNDTEAAHLSDCWRLFALLRKVRARLTAWAVLLTVGGAWLLRDRRRIRRCAWLGPLLPLIPLVLFALYAALDFDRAFTLFHRLLFANDLWLLDPATDLLIRICPEAMFMDMGAMIAVGGLLSTLAVAAVATALTFIGPKGGNDIWKTTPRRGSAPKLYGYKK